MQLKSFLKNISIFLAIFLLVLAWIFYYGKNYNPEIFKNKFIWILNSTPTVVAWNFDFNYKKIPFDVGYIDFTFSKDIDSQSLNKDNFSINPQIDWELSLVSSNTIRYSFTQNLKSWQDISISLSKNLKATNGKNLDKDYDYIVTVVDSPKVTLISPSWNLDNLSQNLSVFFNIPMIPLTSLDNKDNLPCPIEIEPQIEWTCKWTNSSVVEFVPKDFWQWATDYKIKVVNKDWLLYKLSTEAESMINTSSLKFSVSENFNIKDKIKINFNFPPQLQDLDKKVQVFEIDKNWKKSKKNISLSYDPLNESTIIVNLLNSTYFYDKKYILEIWSWIKPKYWNVASNEKKEFNTSSLPFLTELKTYQNVFWSWKIIDTKEFQTWDLLPSNNLFFQLLFDENIEEKDFDKIAFQDEQWRNLKFSLGYEKVKDSLSWSLNDNKKFLKLNLNEKLENDKKYKLIVKKAINVWLAEDIVYEFMSSAKLIIKDIKILDYWKSCLYTNNSLWYDINNVKDNLIKTIPQTKIKNASDYDYINYDDHDIFWIYSTSEWNLANLPDSEYINRGYCPPAKQWEYLYVIRTSLNPKTKYTLMWNSNLEDKYGNKLSQSYQKDYTTWEIKDSDKYVFLSLNKDINLIPSNLPLVINLQTINLDKINFEVCEMDAKSYMQATRKYFDSEFVPNCQKSYSKELPLNNKNWVLSSNKFDLENDIVWWKLTSPFIFLKADTGWTQFRKFFIRWNLNLTYEQASNKNLLFVSDFKWDFVSDLKIEFYKYDYTNHTITQVNPKINLNEETKVYELPEKNDENYTFIYAYKDNYVWIVDLSADMFSDYDFKYYWWVSSSVKNYMYLYTDRPIYKPWDKVYIKWLLRDFDIYWYKKTWLTDWNLEIIDSSSKSVWNMDVKVDNNSNFNAEFIIPKDVSLWQFSFKFTSWEKSFKNDAYFYIEEYKKNDFKIDVEWLKKDYILWESTNLEVSPTYYFGWKLINTNWKYSVLTQNYFFDPKEHSEYQFGEGFKYFDCIYWWYCDYNDDLSDTSDFKIDSRWLANIKYNFPSKQEDWEKIHTFNIEVEDKDTKKTVNKSVSTIIHSTDSYVWLKASYWNDPKSGINSNFIVLDYDGKPLALKNVKVVVSKLEWKEVKKQWIDWYYYNDFSLEKTKEQDFDVTTNSQWIASKNIKTKESWQYEIQAIYTWQNWKSFTSSINVYVSSDDYVSWFNPNNDTTDLIAEKNQVLLWEKAIYTIKSSINSWKALILIEKDDWILDYFVHDIKSYGDKIEIPVKNTYYPNYYLRAFLIWQDSTNPLPVYKRALASTKVSTEYKKLNVKISTDKENYKPWDKVKIEIQVTDKNGKWVSQANWSISMVDESLLAIVWNPKKNPFAFFYDMKRYLWTLMSSSMYNLVEKLEVKDVSWGEKWWAWDEIKWWDSKKKRWTFKDTAFWQADFTTDANWKAIIESENLPDNLTIWNIESIVNEPNTNKIWIWEKTVTTNKNLTINDNLPNFFWVNDKIILSPVILNKTWKDWDFIVSLDITNASIKWKKENKVFIKNWETKDISFEILLNWKDKLDNPNLALSKVNIKVKQVCDTQNCKSYEDEIEKNIIIKDTSTSETVSTIWKTKDSSFDEIIDLSGLKNKSWKASISYWASVFGNLLSSIDYLNAYPYASSEQRTSSITPNVYIKKLYDSVWMDFPLKTKKITYYDFDEKITQEKSLDQVIKEYIVDIRKFQNPDWWFVYWYDINPKFNNYSDLSLSSYILDSFAKLGKLWYKQDEKISLDLLNYIKNRLYADEIEWCKKTKDNNCTYPVNQKLEALNSILTYDLEDVDAIKIYKMINVNENDISAILNESHIISKLLQSTSISSEEKNTLTNKVNKNISKILSEELVYNPKWAYIWKTSSYSRVQNTSLFLKIISNLWDAYLKDNSLIVDNLNRWLISQKQNWSFWSTQDNIAVISAITEYMIKTKELENVNFSAILKLNSEIIDEKKFDNSNKFDLISKNLDLNKLKDKNTLNISKQWDWTLYYDLSLTYDLDSKDIKARDEWFGLIKEYYDYNEYQTINDVKKQEWEKYEKWLISYSDLKYKKNIFEYLVKINSFRVWQLVVVRNKIISPETRDKVIFEWFIPAWSQLVNPNLSTSSKTSLDFETDIFEKKEFRQDRIFAYTNVLESGIHEFSYLLRFTYKWEYIVNPSVVSESYNSEVFGRSEWEKLIVN